MTECGLDVQDIHPTIRVGRPGTPEWNWIDRVISSFLPTMIELGVVSEEAGSEFEAVWTTYATDPNSLFVSPPVIDIIATRPAVR